MNDKFLRTAIQLFIIIFLMSFSVKNDKCTEWQPWCKQGRESKLYIKICDNETDGSGYKI